MKKPNDPLTPREHEAHLLEVRAKIAANRQTRAEQQNLLGREDAQAQARAWLEPRARRGEDALRDLAQSFQHPGPPRVALLYAGGADPQDLEALLCCLCRDPLDRFLRAELARLIPPDRPSPSQIEAEGNRLDRAWRALEREEERIVRQLEAMGLTPDRRGDADPATVLADDDALASA